MAVYEANAENFDELIDTEYAVVDFYGTYCAPCKMLEPVYHEASNDFLMLRFLKVCTDEQRALGKKYRIFGVPSVFFFKNGKCVHEVTGAMTREELNGHIAKLLYGEQKKDGEQ